MGFRGGGVRGLFPVADYFISRIRFRKAGTVHEQVMTGGRSENYKPEILKAVFLMPFS